LTSHNDKVEENFLLQDNYRLLFDRTPISIVLLNDIGQIVEANSATSDLFGFKRENLIKFKFSDVYVVPEDQLNRMKKIFTFLFKGGIFGPEDIQIYNKDKNLIWVNVIASKIELEKNSYIQVLTQDISQRKILEQEIKESEGRYRGLYESSPNSLALSNNKGVILNVNSATEKIFGFKKNEVIGKKYMDLGIFTVEQLKTMNKRYHNALKGEKLNQLEWQIKKRDGTMAWISFQNSLKKIGNEILIEGIIQDITERKIA
jgi:PAS domain S-box-containing protein